MNKYDLSFEELCDLFQQNPTSFDDFSIDYIKMKEKRYDIAHSKKHDIFDDSGICFVSNDENAYDVIKINEGQIIWIYLVEHKNNFETINIVHASHVLEQVFDNNNNLVSEKLKPFKD